MGILLIFETDQGTYSLKKVGKNTERDVLVEGSDLIANYEIVCGEEGLVVEALRSNSGGFAFAIRAHRKLNFPSWGILHQSKDGEMRHIIETPPGASIHIPSPPPTTALDAEFLKRWKDQMAELPTMKVTPVQIPPGPSTVRTLQPGANNYFQMKNRNKIPTLPSTLMGEYLRILKNRDGGS